MNSNSNNSNTSNSPSTLPTCPNCGDALTSPRELGGDIVCQPCYIAGLVHGHQHVDHEPAIADCPLCQQEARNSSQLRDTDSTRAAIADAALTLGCSASVEYPGHVRIATINGRIAAVGTANGPWEADCFSSTGTEDLGQPEHSIQIPDTHNREPEGIARYVAGRLSGVIEWTAYPTAREAETANRDERRARNGGRK